MNTTAENIQISTSNFPHATKIIKSSESTELFFAVVGHVGSGISEVADKLNIELVNQGYDVEVVKASTAIGEWASKNGHSVPGVSERAKINETIAYQDLGDTMRKHTQDFAAVAQGLISKVRKLRADKTGVTMEEGLPVEPDDKKRAYIFDSIRHPSEVHLLRNVYHESFSLIGVVCQEPVRRERLLEKFFDHKKRKSIDSCNEVNDLMVRDADDKEIEYGQHVADAFFEADYFVDNTIDLSDRKNFHINEILGRLIDIVTHSKIVRPTSSETAMHHAMTAQIRSACLSRQVGAALVDQDGDIISTGTNEVPKAGGGVYGKSFSMTADYENEFRCFCDDEPTCSSNKEQNKLAKRIMSSFPDIMQEKNADIISILRKAGLKDLLEFSRAVHAEMDAITTAARKGKSVSGAKMFVTTFPCHYCARHIVASGIHEVQYIEPYPKSLAMSLHKDAITPDEVDWIPPGEGSEQNEFNSKPNYQKVLFRPFVGVSPRLYIRAFTKDRPLKDKETGEIKIGDPTWGNKWNIMKISYTQLEAELTKVVNNVD